MREVLGDWILRQSAIGIDVKNPSVVVKSLFEFSNVIVIEAVDIKLHHANDLIVIFGSRDHRSLRFLGWNADSDEAGHAFQ